MGSHPDAATKELPRSLGLDDLREDLPAGGEVGSREILIENSFVCSQVHVAFGPVIQDKDFAVAIRVEGAGVAVEIALHFDWRDAESLSLSIFAMLDEKIPLPKPDMTVPRTMT